MPFIAYPEVEKKFLTAQYVWCHLLKQELNHLYVLPRPGDTIEAFSDGSKERSVA